MRWEWVSVLTIVACGLAATSALAQRGVGQPEGVARQAVQPEIVSLAGNVVKVESGPCQTTTGRSPLGTHFLMKTTEGKTLNIHLGPAAAVEFVAKELEKDKVVKVEAFRTEQMKQDHYVACSLAYDGRTVTLRNEWLQPVWAAAQGGDGGRGWNGASNGRGRGYGRGGNGAGNGRGYGRGAGWGRGPGSPRAGSGWGYGPRAWFAPQNGGGSSQSPAGDSPNP